MTQTPKNTSRDEILAAADHWYKRGWKNGIMIGLGIAIITVLVVLLV